MATARGQITISDINDAKTLYVFLSASDNVPSIQGYNKDSNNYTPDWANSPFLISPRLIVSGDGEISIDTLLSGNNSLTWTVNDVEITGDNQALGVLLINSTTLATAREKKGSVTSADYGRLLVYKNLVGDRRYIKVKCHVVWEDPSTGLEIEPEAELSFSRNDSSAAMARAVIDINDSNQSTGVFHNGTPASIKLTSKLMRGAEDDSTDVTYAWRNSAGIAITGTSMHKIDGKDAYKLENATGKSLIVYPDGVQGREVFYCAITDTDSNSPTYNQVFTASQAIVDLSDPWYVDIEASATQLKNGVGTITLEAVVKRRNDNLEYAGTVTYAWIKVDVQTGIRDVTWRTSMQAVSSPAAGANPKANGWYTKSGTEYSLTNDTTVVSGKTYYTANTTTGSNTKSITINKNDVNGKATFVCTATIS